MLSRIFASISDPEIKTILHVHEVVAKFDTRQEQASYEVQFHSKHHEAMIKLKSSI
jgi:hypothetical protein